MLNTVRRTAASSSRAARLASAAQASAAQSYHSPPPAPTPTSAWMTAEATESEIDDSVTATQKRLSLLGRQAKWRQNPGPHALPEDFSEGVEDLIRQGNRRLLRDDLRRSRPSSSRDIVTEDYKNTHRSALLHLAQNSASRYATIRQVLDTTASGLGEPTIVGVTPAGEVQWQAGWSPKKVTEVGCGTAEGAWAAAEVWPASLEEWEGLDSSGKLIKTARDLLAQSRTQVDEATEGMETETTSTMETEAANGFDDERAEPIAEEHPIASIKTRFEYSKGTRSIPSASGTDAEGRNTTLVVSAFHLLSLHSDSAREQHVKRLWRSGAEAIVLIEDGSDRGFAAIASARALLLELGEEDRQTSSRPTESSVPEFDERGREKVTIGGVEFYEERPSDRQVPTDLEAEASDGEVESANGRGCWVVAPCPHDRPCPLLHPFALQTPHDAVPFRGTERASAHHQATHIGLKSCHHPVRFTPPRWARDSVAEQSRRKRQRGGREERSAQISYVVVKRGERPRYAKAQGDEASSAESALTNLVLAAAPETRRGILDELRKGESVPRRLAEDIVGETEDDSVGAEEEEMDAEDAAAREELLALLPEQLRRAGGGRIGGNATAEAAALEQAIAALQLQPLSKNSKAQDVWEASKEAADEGDEPTSEAREAELEAQQQNSAFLSAGSATEEIDPDQVTQSEMVESAGESAAGTVDEIAAFDAALAPEVVAGAASLLAPSMPRIVLPPIKKGGHVTLDACHPSGAIHRYTVSRSSGRQSYQEARKSAWADQWAQDPVEEYDFAEPSLRSRDRNNGKTASASASASALVAKRKGWGQWSRISSADEAAGVKEEALAATTTSKIWGYPHAKTSTPRASNRASAYIGADQVMPQSGSGGSSSSSSIKSLSKSSPSPSSSPNSGERGGKDGDLFVDSDEKPRRSLKSSRKRSMADYDAEIRAALANQRIV